MGKSTPSAPPPPDPAKLAAAQAAANKEAAIAGANLNRVDQVTPHGNLTYTRPANYWTTDKKGNPVFNDNADPWVVTASLHAAEQANLDRQRALTGRVLDLGQTQLGNIAATVAQPLDFAGLPAAAPLDVSGLPGADAPAYGTLGPAPTLGYGNVPALDALRFAQAPTARPLDFGGASAPPDVAAFAGPNSGTTDALYRAYASRLDPQWERERGALEARLANQGITVRTNAEAYDRAFDTFNQARADAYNQALGQAIHAGVAENANAFQRGLAARQQGVTEAGQLFGAGLSARQQGVAEAGQRYNADLARRQQGISEADALYQAALAGRAQRAQEMGQQFQDQLTARQQAAAERGQLYNTGMALRQQALQELMTRRNQPINELAALLGTSGGVAQPQFAAVPQASIAAPDVAGIHQSSYATQLAALQRQQQMQAAQNKQLAQVGTGILAGAGTPWWLAQGAGILGGNY